MNLKMTHEQKIIITLGHRDILSLLGETQMKFMLPVPTNGCFARSNGVKFNGLPDTQEERGFQCYVENPTINTFDFIVISLTSDPNNPYTEYLMPIPSGHAVWNEISNLSNPSIVTNSLGENKFNKNLDILPEKTPMGHRRDMLICNSKMVSKVISRNIKIIL